MESEQNSNISCILKIAVKFMRLKYPLLIAMGTMIVYGNKYVCIIYYTN